MPLNNPFIKTNSLDSDIATAKLFEHAVQTDLSKINRSWANVPALTDGTRMYINSDEVLEEIMPTYKTHPVETLELLLHHENLHMELKHHKRYFQMVKQLEKLRKTGEIQGCLTHDEVNIIMDILVHDVLFRKREGLTDVGIQNLAQMRNRNSLGYTFKGKSLEAMLEEYARHKTGEDEEEGETSEQPDDSEDKEDGDGKSEGIGDTKSEDSKPKEKDDDSKDKTDAKDDPDAEGKGEEKGHGEGGSGDDKKPTKDDSDPETKDDKKEKKPEEESHHDETDWSGLEKRGGDEFITKDEADRIDKAITKLRKMKLSLSNLTKTLNGLVTDKKERTYSIPSYTAIQGSDLIFKGHRRARASLYLVFDASGSMGRELETFKEIISKSIPQAMNSPCEWFAGDYAKIAPYEKNYQGDYYKGTFKDIMPVEADDGFSNDGDRVIALCAKAEEKGFTPIGVTDGGGGVYDEDTLKKLKKTVLIGTNNKWLRLAKSINPNIKTLCIYDEYSDEEDY